MATRHATSIVWFRRDLRLADHRALARAVDESDRVVCAFVLDPPLLRGPEIGAPIVQNFFDALAELRASLRALGSDLALLEGDFTTELRALAARVAANALYFNVDYEPHAIERDRAVAEAFRADGATVVSLTDHVYFGARDVLKSGGDPYTVYTPYRRRWLERLREEPPVIADPLQLAQRLAGAETIGATRNVPEPEAFGHERSERFPKGGATEAARALETFVTRRIGAYAKARNVPAQPGTAHLSPHLRAGTIGIRTCVAAALRARDERDGEERTGAETWLGELIWRDFYQQILANFPHVASGPFDERAQRIAYREAPGDYERWASATTGYPIVDAAMRQLQTYGWMHNRLRMIVASFLTKDLLLDYRLGERHFEQHLADADRAANNGGWQWSASTGTDAAPYFRIFNPVTQSETFDRDGSFIRSMLPELGRLSGRALHAPWTLSPLEAEALQFQLGRDYPQPIVDHAEARTRALAAYAPVLGPGKAPVPQ